MPDDPVKLVRKRLDAAGIAAHLHELAASSPRPEVRIKGDPAAMSDATTAPLDVLASRLAAGDLAALQIRFFRDGAWWIDTVVRVRGGFRLVRTREGA